ncbi:NAC transcription factor 29-like [Olea europaea subsp. europaea]|uniref:NAC transcription factor 29-like n=1 Tax=Olea europaea subsp. europaea TaxID=158383 RepID=A0A8S0S9P0_OLEEU|nr:NAC transcription factor 29-like [Olea europaea subsp. europaea]
MESQLSDDEHFRPLTADFRFKPTHDELIVHYLMKKIKKEELPRNKINVINLYEFNPEILARANTIVKHNGVDVGSRKTLVYYEGKPPIKTSWIMHEYTVNNPLPVQKSSASNMKLDDWVLCRIRKNENRKQKRDHEIQESDHNNTDEDACHQENKHGALEDSMHDAPEDNLPYYKLKIPLVDPFINDNYQSLPNVAFHNALSIPQHQNVVTYCDLVPIPIVPPYHLIRGYVYNQYPIGYIADVRGGLHPELFGIQEMDMNKLLDLVSGEHLEIPGLDGTNLPDFIKL